MTDWLTTLQSTLNERRYTVNKAGMPDLLRSQKGQRFLNTVAYDCNCLVCTDDQVHVDNIDSDISSPISDAGLQQIMCHAVTSRGHRLLVCNGDLTKEKVDAIVNAANTDLKHVGGLAFSISKAGEMITSTLSVIGWSQTVCCMIKS